MNYRLMSRDQVKSCIMANDGRFGAEDAVNFARQLYDVMGENERLREELRGWHGVGEIALEIQKDLRSKHSAEILPDGFIPKGYEITPQHREMKVICVKCNQQINVSRCHFSG